VLLRLRAALTAASSAFRYDEGMGPGQYGGAWTDEFAAVVPVPTPAHRSDALASAAAVHKSDTTWPLITKHVDFFNELFAGSRDLCAA
jgi:hypothetical protein